MNKLETSQLPEKHLIYCSKTKLTISLGRGGNLGPFNNTFKASGGNIGGGNDGGGKELSSFK